MQPHEGSEIVSVKPLGGLRLPFLECTFGCSLCTWPVSPLSLAHEAFVTELSSSLVSVNHATLEQPVILFVLKDAAQVPLPPGSPP